MFEGFEGGICRSRSCGDVNFRVYAVCTSMGGDFAQRWRNLRLCRKEVSAMVFKRYQKPRIESHNNEANGADFFSTHKAEGEKQRSGNRKYRQLTWTGLLGFAQSPCIYLYYPSCLIL